MILKLAFRRVVPTFKHMSKLPTFFELFPHTYCLKHIFLGLTQIMETESLVIP